MVARLQDHPVVNSLVFYTTYERGNLLSGKGNLKSRA
jgi:hypothetical protein